MAAKKNTKKIDKEAMNSFNILLIIIVILLLILLSVGLVAAISPELYDQIKASIYHLLN